VERARARRQGQPHDRKGWVSLNGEVEWDYQRSAAENAVRDLMGVTGVSNLVKVKPKVSPADVEKKIHEALSRQAEREANRLAITVNGSQVTLRGTVNSWTERDAVQGAAWATPGVSVVVNDLLVDA
jgi:osmotically-inducible protein OsmY